MDAGFLTSEVRLNQCLDAMKLENRIYQSAGLPLATKLGGYITKRKSEGVSLFPNASFHAISNTELVYSLSVVPASEEKSLIRYDVFSSRGQNNANAGDISETLKDFLNEGIEILEREYQCHVSRSEYVLSTIELPSSPSSDRLTCYSQPTPDLAPEAGGTPALPTNPPTELTNISNQKPKSKSSKSSNPTPNLKKHSERKCTQR